MSSGRQGDEGEGAHAEAPFDAAAPHYDGDVAAQAPVFERMRRVIRAELAARLNPGRAVLDVGCGSGADTLWLLQQGFTVVAVDPSAAMLDVTRQAAEDRGLAGRLTTVQAGAAQLLRAWPKQAPALGGAVSSLGPLNAEADLPAAAEALARLLPAGAPAVISPMAALCPWEIAAFMAKGQPRRALARLGAGPVAAPVSENAAGVTIDTWYRWSGAFEAVFAPHFHLAFKRGLGLFLPPPYLRFTRTSPRLLSALDTADAALAHRWPFSHLGDHTLYVFERR